MDDFDSIIKPARSFISERLSQKETDAIASESKAKYEVLLPEVPYIGGDDNSLTETLYMARPPWRFTKP